MTETTTEEIFVGLRRLGLFKDTATFSDLDAAAEDAHNKIDYLGDDTTMTDQEQKYRVSTTLLGNHSAASIKEQIQIVKKQYAALRRLQISHCEDQNDSKDGKLVDLIKANEYVGYKRQSFEVTIETLKATVVRLNPAESLFIREDCQTPINLTINRIQGILLLEDARPVKKERPTKLQREDIISIQGVVEPDKNGKESLTQSNQIAGSSLSILTKASQITIKADNRQERDILAHELNQIICQGQKVDCQMAGTSTRREDVMPFINPIQAFNAFSLSQTCPHTVTRQENNFRATYWESEENKEGLPSHENIIRMSDQFIAYFRDGMRCYVSQTLRREPWILDGVLMKEPQVRIRFLKNKYYQTFVTIDFKRQMIRFKPSGMNHADQDEFVEEKDLAFSDIIDVKKIEPELANRENKPQNKADLLPFRTKFLLRTSKREYNLYAKDEQERQVWLEGLQKVLFLNHQSKSGKQITSSQEFQVSSDTIGGNVMKAIENLGLFNSNEYNKRYIEISFGKKGGQFQFFEGLPKDNYAYQTFKLSELVRCRELDAQEVNAKIDERQNKRSRSMLSRLAHGRCKRCEWDFGFILTFKSKQFELYSPTRQDRDSWVKVLSIVAEANSAGEEQSIKEISTLKNRFKEKEKRQEEEKLSEEEKALASKRKLEDQIREEAYEWLRKNQSDLVSSSVNLGGNANYNYSSETLKICKDGVQGTCQSRLVQAPESADSSTTANNSAQVNLFLNFRTQLLLVKKQDLPGISRLTFNEIDKVEPHIDGQFIMAVKGNAEKIVTCKNEKEKQLWVRCLKLVMEIQKAQISYETATKVNIFAFEKVLRAKVRALKHQHGLIVSHSPSPSPSPSRSPSQSPSPQLFQPQKIILNQCKNGSESSQPGAVTSLDSSSLIDAVTRDSSIKAQRSSRLRHKTSTTLVELKAKAHLVKPIKSATFLKKSKVIEGYLCRETISEKMTSSSASKAPCTFDCRYVRIVFSSGKLNVKENQETSKMRSIMLKDFVTVKRLLTHEQKQKESTGEDGTDPNLVSIVLNNANLPQSGEQDWPYKFELVFKRRSMILRARTRLEFDEWTHVFTLIEKMNRAGLCTTELSPYIFEAQQHQTTSKQSEDLNKLAKRQQSQMRSPPQLITDYNNSFSTAQKQIELGGKKRDIILSVEPSRRNRFQSSPKQQDATSKLPGGRGPVRAIQFSPINLKSATVEKDDDSNTILTNSIIQRTDGSARRKKKIKLRARSSQANKPQVNDIVVDWANGSIDGGDNEANGSMISWVTEFENNNASYNDQSQPRRNANTAMNMLLTTETDDSQFLFKEHTNRVALIKKNKNYHGEKDQNLMLVQENNFNFSNQGFSRNKQMETIQTQNDQQEQDQKVTVKGNSQAISISRLSDDQDDIIKINFDQKSKQQLDQPKSAVQIIDQTAEESKVRDDGKKLIKFDIRKVHLTTSPDNNLSSSWKKNLSISPNIKQQRTLEMGNMQPLLKARKLTLESQQNLDQIQQLQDSSIGEKKTQVDNSDEMRVSCYNDLAADDAEAVRQPTQLSDWD